MRLFVAISMPKHVREKLEGLQEPIDGINWERHGQFHLTLRFIGEVDAGITGSLQQKLGHIHQTSFKLRLDGLGTFPARGYPRVLWVGIEENDDLTDLQHEVERCCREAGLDAENRPFNPHITIGKVKGADKKNVQAFLDHNGAFNVSDIPVDRFILYSSQLKPDGAVHKPVDTYELSG